MTESTAENLRRTGSPARRERRPRPKPAGANVLSWSASYQIDQRVEHDPHHVDEAPVEPDHLDRRAVTRGEPPAPGKQHDPDDEAEPDHHVQPMDRGRDEIKAEEQLRALAERPGDGEVGPGPEMVREVFGPLEAEFEDHEGKPEQPGRGKALHQPAGIPRRDE